MKHRNIIFPSDPGEEDKNQKNADDKTLQVADFLGGSDRLASTRKLSISELDKTVAETHIDMMDTNYVSADESEMASKYTSASSKSNTGALKRHVKKKKNRKKEILKVILFLLLTAVFLFDGINIAGFLMNGSSVENKTAVFSSETPSAITEAEVTATPSLSADSLQETAIGSLQVGDSDIYLRKDTDITSDMTGIAAAGSVYKVYEVIEANGYTWYKLDEDAWMPDDGTWAVYTAY